MSGTFYYTGQALIDLAIRIDHLPAPGGDVFGEDAGLHVGGGFNTMWAARQVGAPVSFAGALGTGPFSDKARAALASAQIPHLGPTLPAQDLGYCVALTDSRAERTFISTAGAETHLPLTAFDNLPLTADDVVFICGYALIHADNRAAVCRLAERILAGQTPRPAHLIFDTTPMIGDIPLEALALLERLGVIWSLNETEAQILASRLNLPPTPPPAKPSSTTSPTGPATPQPATPAPEQTTAAPQPATAAPDQAAAPSAADLSSLAGQLAARLGTVVLRAGAQGAWVATTQSTPTTQTTEAGQPAQPAPNVTHVPSLPVTPVDTNGAGDAHTGALAAFLLEGLPLPAAVRLANIAAALSTRQVGPATAPTRAQIDSAG